ncbi:hypothetical protein [Novosphingobium sp. KA1]|uniref:hypothetical protein n=1 Tax=Novosphingobium sp. (strain KA1) TaxID=164608 RepID=UPI001A8D8E16|nr:hypothetical protein [Novosphingobium sp. KA1]QSR19680.1 hypothetical protein CA833_21275 [Novosphingobium sp. KA1]
MASGKEAMIFPVSMRFLKLAWLAGFAIIAVLSLLLWLWSPGLESYEFEKADEGIQTMPKSSCADDVTRKFPGDKSARSGACHDAEEHRLAVNDLVQQTRAADAAVAQVVLAKQAIWMSFVQTIGSIAALIAAAIAALYAHLAFDHERSRSALAERPWLKIGLSPASNWSVEKEKEDATGTMIDKGRRKIKCDVRLENVGNCIAQNVVMSLRFYSGAGKPALDNAIKAGRADLDAPRFGEEDRTNILHDDFVTIDRTVYASLEKRKHIYALACASYTLPDGNKGFSWQAFRLASIGPDGTQSEVKLSDLDVDQGDIVFQQRGWTGAE